MPRSVRESARLESLPVTRRGLNSSRLHGAVKCLAGRRRGFVVFYEAGAGRPATRDGEVGPSAGHAGGALQTVDGIGGVGEKE